MIILESTLTTFEASFVFWGSWGSIKNWLELKIEPPLVDLALLNPWNTQLQLLVLWKLGNILFVLQMWKFRITFCYNQSINRKEENQVSLGVDHRRLGLSRRTNSSQLSLFWLFWKARRKQNKNLRHAIDTNLTQQPSQSDLPWSSV